MVHRNHTGISQILGSDALDASASGYSATLTGVDMKRALTVAAALVGAGALLLGATAVANADHRGKAVAGAKAQGPIKALVSAGTITQAEADAFHAAMKTAAAAKRAEQKAAHQAARDNALAALVANGTITQAQADLIKAGGSALLDAVKAGTISYAQLGAVRDAMQAAKPATDPMKDLVKQVTDQLVAENKISSASAAAIVAALPLDKAGHRGKGHQGKGHGGFGFGKGAGKGHGGMGMRS